MNRSNIGYDILFIIILLACMLALLLLDVGEGNSFIIKEIFNFGHIPLFGFASLIILWVLNRRKWPVREFKYYIISFLAAIIVGVATEFLQSLTPNRDFGVSDMVRDSIGALTFLIIAYPSPSHSKKLFFKFKGLSFMIILLATTPIYLAVIEMWQIKRDFPLLSSLETLREINRWESDEASFELSESHATHGVHSMKVHYMPGVYPGISLERFYGDWNGYEVFSFDVFLQGSTSMALSIRINDADHNQTFRDRFNDRILLGPGANHIVVGLADVRKAPLTRSMDMKHISDVTLFSYLSSEHRTLYFDNFRLERYIKP